jgi:ferrous iron transport protein A
MTLAQLAIGERGKIITLRGDSPVLQRLYEMGLTRGCEIEVLRYAPLGDPLEILIRNYNLSLRKSEAALVEVERV